MPQAKDLMGAVPGDIFPSNHTLTMVIRLEKARKTLKASGLLAPFSQSIHLMVPCRTCSEQWFSTVRPPIRSCRGRALQEKPYRSVLYPAAVLSLRAGRALIYAVSAPGSMRHDDDELASPLPDSALRRSWQRISGFH
jgi:hypothetical protein